MGDHGGPRPTRVRWARASGGLLKPRSLGRTPRVSCSVSLGWGLRSQHSSTSRVMPRRLSGEPGACSRVLHRAS